MWAHANFARSLTESGLYEAGGSAFWVPLGPESRKFFKDSISWSELNEMSENHWEKKQAFRDRLMFPVTLHTFVSSEEVRNAGGPEKLQQSFRLYCGHAVLMTFWLELGKSLQEGDAARIEKLVQAALTTTIQVKELASDGDVSRWAIRALAAIMARMLLCLLLRCSLRCRRERPVQEQCHHAGRHLCILDAPLQRLPQILSARNVRLAHNRQRPHGICHKSQHCL